ncbi:unnamed protein product, partial [Prunus brigantina]
AQRDLISCSVAIENPSMPHWPILPICPYPPKAYDGATYAQLTYAQLTYAHLTVGVEVE